MNYYLYIITLILSYFFLIIETNVVKSICSSPVCRCDDINNSIYCYRALFNDQLHHFSSSYGSGYNTRYERINANYIQFDCAASKSLKKLHCSNISPSTPIYIDSCVDCNDSPSDVFVLELLLK